MNPPAVHLMNGQIQPTTYDELLKNSISYFLGEYPKSLSGLSDLVSVFHRLVLDLKDPPLEVMWFYCALTFHSYKPSILLPPSKLLVAKDLLQMLNTCSCLCNMVKKVAVIAPVLYLLYHLELNFSARDPSLRQEIGMAVEGIVSYISICCSQYLDEAHRGSDSLGAYIFDLIRVWTVDRIRDSNETNVLASFFPTLDNEFQQEVTGGLGYLAGVVMHEALLLRLCLRISPGIDKEDLQNDMFKLAIQTIKGFQNFYFLDMLLKMLSEPSLPVAASLSSEDAVLLQKVLYDAVLLVDYSFYSGRWVESSVGQSKRLALAWVLAADHAIQFARATNDQASATSYLSAFCESQLVAALIKWVHSQAGMVDQNARPDITTPGALMKWLLVLHDQGIQIFDHSTSMLHAKAVACTLRVESESPNLHGENLNQNVFDLNKADVIEVSGDLWLTSNKTDASKKRKEAPVGVQESQIKQVRLDLSETSAEGNLLPFSGDGGARRGNVVINISSSSDDDDMEIVG